MFTNGRHRTPAGGPGPISARPPAPLTPALPPSPVIPAATTRRGRRAVVAGVAVAAVATVGVTLASVMAPALPATAPVTADASLGPGPSTAAITIRPAAGSVRATVLDIASIGVHSELIDLDVDAAGVLVPPPITAVAGWFTGSVVPGEVGPAVIAGHVDSRAGPGVFFRLADIPVGAEVRIGRSDGASVRYRVTGVQTVPKDAFPTSAVYGPTPGAELRLITCGGQFDRSARRYLRNVIVSAVLVDPG